MIKRLSDGNMESARNQAKKDKEAVSQANPNDSGVSSVEPERVEC